MFGNEKKESGKPFCCSERNSGIIFSDRCILGNRKMPEDGGTDC